MNAQEIFNKVAWHLMTQNQKAFVEEEKVPQRKIICLYWNKTANLKCAIGCLIPESLYNENMESAGIVLANDLVLDALKKLGIDVSDLQTEMVLDHLQYIHDQMDVEEWKQGLIKLATEYKLEVPSFLGE